MRKHLWIGLTAAAILAGPAAAVAAECTRLDTLWPKEETETTASGEFKWVGENMSPREYAEFLESKGSPAWQCMIAGYYFTGEGYPQDFEKAAGILLKNDIRFCNPLFINLGAMFKHGLGVAKDPAKAAYWFRASFASSPDRAQFLQDQDVAGIIEDIQSVAGVMIKADFDAAHLWLEEALEASPEELYQRGLGYLKTGEAGAGFPIADAFLRHAAKAGHERAALTHARLYLDCKIGAYAGRPWYYLPRFAKAGNVEAAALLGLDYADDPRKRYSNDYEARDWLGRALAGDLPDGLREEVEAALAEVKARIEEDDRRRKR